MEHGKQTHYVGMMSEARFHLECLRRGWDIATPHGNIQPYDFVIRRPGAAWNTVQVKTAYLSKNGHGNNVAIAASIRQSNATRSQAYKDGDFDLLAVVYQEQMWLIPWEAMRYLSSHISLRGFEVFRFDNDYVYDETNTALLIEAMHAAKALGARRKLTMDQVREIRQLAENGTARRTLESQFSVSKSVLARILRNENYSEGATIFQRRENRGQTYRYALRRNSETGRREKVE